MIEALVTLRRQIDLIGAEIRITERQLEKAAKGSEPWRAATLRKEILTGKVKELQEGLNRLEKA